MIESIIRFSIKQRIFLVLAAGIIAGLGIMAYQNLTIDVFPDPSPPLVQIYTEAHGMAPEEVERLISYPIESSMFGLPKTEMIRSFSTFALSMVTVYFEQGTDIYWARELVSQRLLEVRDQIPEQAKNPVLGPIATGLGMVYLYYLEGDGYSAMELRILQDWLVKFELKAVPQVSQVLSMGGDIKQYQILIDPQSLLKFGLTISDIANRVKQNNQNIGASFITKGKQEYIVRSIGLIKSINHLENILVSEKGGTPLYLKDVARVEILPAIKRGAVLVNGEGEKVVGQVLKLFGSNNARVINDLEIRMEEINRSLPPGVRIVSFYNQAALVKKCFSTASDMEKDLLAVPEITGVLTRIGRGEVGGHAHFVNEAQMLLDLKPERQWKNFGNKNDITREVEHRLGDYPGVTLNITQPIAHNLDELISGVKAQLAVKLYGENFDILEEKSTEIRKLLASLEGAADVQVDQLQNHIQIIPDRSGPPLRVIFELIACAAL